MNYFAAALCLGFALAGQAGDAVREFEVKPDPPGEAKQVFTFRFSPAQAASYDMIAFDCYLQQRFTIPDEKGNPVAVVHDAPLPFTFRERGVSLVADLDKYISFWVPVGVKELRQMFGPIAIKTNAPGTVARFEITAIKDGKKVWQVRANPSGVQAFKPVGATP